MTARAAAAVLGAAVLAALLALAIPIASPIVRVPVALALAVVVGAAAARLVAGWLRRDVGAPLAALAAAADDFAAGHLAVRVDAAGPEEVQRAARAFNAMAERVGARYARLADRQEALEAALGQMREGLVLVDRDRRLVFMNAAARDLFVASAVAAGRPLIEAIHHYDVDALLAGVLREGQRGEREVEVLGGQPRLLWVHADPIRGLDGGIEGALLVAQDLSDLRRADLMRRQFVANASHELRTPLASIRALAESLLGPVDPATAERRVAQIVAETDRLGRLAGDILDLSAIESGAAPLRLETMPVREVVDEVVERLRPAITAKRLDVSARVPDGLTVRADRARLEQALTNLVENAVAYTERGSITITAAREDGTVAIAVADTGIGIAAEHLPRVFERFYRVDSARSRAAGGTGLGLAIVKHIALAHGGRVTAESVEGQGSTFTLHLPAAQEPAPAAG